jgi:hypothetical protein
MSFIAKTHLLSAHSYSFSTSGPENKLEIIRGEGDGDLADHLPKPEHIGFPGKNFAMLYLSASA